MPKGLPISYIKKWGISKLAWKKFREGALTKGVPTRTASIKKRLKGGNPKMKKKTRRRRRGLTIPIATVGGLAVGLIEPAKCAIAGNLEGAGEELIRRYTGYSMMHQTWDFNYLWGGTIPLVLGVMTSKILGRYINPVLARNKIPIIRL